MEATVNQADNEAKLLEYLGQEALPLTLIVLERREKGFGTTYAHFKDNYVGHPYDDSYPDIVRDHPLNGSQHYNRPIISSYSNQGSLVQVRETGRVNHDNRADDFFVVTANLHSRQIQEWHVSKATITGEGSSLRMELILSDKPFAPLTTEQVPDQSLDQLQQVLVRKIQQQKDQQVLAACTKVILSGQGCWLCPTGQPAEALAPIAKLAHRVDVFYAKFGRLPLLRVPETKIEKMSADTIAA